MALGTPANRTSQQTGQCATVSYWLVTHTAGSWRRGRTRKRLASALNVSFAALHGDTKWHHRYLPLIELLKNLQRCRLGHKVRHSLP